MDLLRGLALKTTEDWQGLSVNFGGIRFPGNKTGEILKAFGEILEQNSVQNSGRNFEVFSDLHNHGRGKHERNMHGIVDPIARSS